MTSDARPSVSIVMLPPLSTNTVPIANPISKKWEKIQNSTCLKALDMLQGSGAPIAGAVLTQVNIRRHRKYSPEEVVHYYGRYQDYYVN
jgi:Mrp family chromosome partitioning ATPase